MRVKRIVLLLMCFGLSWAWSATIRSDLSTLHDFGQLYYGARCAMRHADPYNRQAVFREFDADGGVMPKKLPRDEWGAKYDFIIPYPPTAFFVTIPLAVLPAPSAGVLWFGLLGGGLVAAAFLMWELGEAAASIICGCMAGFVLANSVVLVTLQNAAGVVAGFSVIAAWSFLRERFALCGVLLLAYCLMIKPHDAGLVWLYFLLAGGTGRKRALQTLAVTAVLGVCAVIWITPSSPHWVQELGKNLVIHQSRGAPDDPGPTRPGGVIPVVNLQNSFSLIKNESHFYNPASYLVCVVLILRWIVAVLRKRPTRNGALLALAAISALTLLPVYHRTDDAKLLLLTIPACALLWVGGGLKRWIALGLTSAAILVTSDVPIIILMIISGKLRPSLATFGGKVEMLLLQPAPLVLLAAGCFYLWVFVRYDPEQGLGQKTAADELLDTALAE